MRLIADDRLKRATILIVDDQPANVRVLTRMLDQDGYGHILATTDPTETLALVAEHAPDLILLDLQMPRMDGFDILALLAQRSEIDRFLPVLVLTADITHEAKERALRLGAKDFLTKPFDLTEVKLRIRNLIEIRMLYRDLAAQNQELEVRVESRTAELEAARQEILDRLARAAEYRDDQTGQHTRRVARGARLLAAAMGLPEDEALLIERAAPLHDVGKIGVPDTILLKPTDLAEDELREMRRHPLIGAEILGRGESALLRTAEQIALTHHERWDGAGYPHGLEGDEIPLAGRIVAVVDVFDALAHERPYKRAWRVQDAVRYVREHSGTQFDPAIVAAFLDLCEHRLSDLLVDPGPEVVSNGTEVGLDRR